MKLIVNADDYGLTRGVSLGILEAMRDGIVTDTSAIVNTCDFEECAKIAIENGVNEMGIHCLATMGYPLLPKEEVKSLVDENGQFYTRAIFKTKDIDVSELEKECSAQIEKFLVTGLKLNHIDSHHGFMTKTPAIFDMFIRLAKKYNVPLRNEASVHNMEGFDCQAKGVKSVDKVYFSHAINVDEILEFINTSSGDYEFIEIGCHPGYSDEILRKISPCNDEREKDLAIFKDIKLKAIIQKKHIECSSYSELV